MAMLTKRCQGPCGRTLLLSFFVRNRHSPDGHGALCMACRREQWTRRPRMNFTRCRSNFGDRFK
jgi:hypothetical protein